MGKVVVLGGGACGLSAAWELYRNGMNVVVIEAEHLLGGLCKTVNYKGFNFALGGHRFISKNSGLLHKISSIMGNELLVSERVSAIRLNGKDFKYPLSAGDILQQTSVSFAARCFMDYVFQSMYMKVKQSSDCSLEDWVIHRFGKTLYNNFFRDYTNKLWGISSDNISSDLILEIPCFYNDEIWEMADNQLYSKCIEDLLELGIDIESRIIDYFFTSAKHAYPIYQLDYRIHLDKLVSCIGGLKNVSICGRNGLFKYIFMDEAMEMGFAAAMVVGKK
ncbi:MAG: FAD-dependent oxidoreductase [Candidatus Scalindua sp.]|nr:FAD-dependent oxidoreductase [Candidatus Scalindua sp.]